MKKKLFNKQLEGLLKTPKMKQTTTTSEPKEKIGSDLKEYISKNIGDIAISHLEAWKDRYASYGGNKRLVEEDICINHDHSLEVERAEEDLGRKLNGKEYDHFTGCFEKEVIRQWKRGNY